MSLRDTMHKKRNRKKRRTIKKQARRRKTRAERHSRRHSKVKDGVLKEPKVPGPNDYIMAQNAHLDKQWDSDINTDETNTDGE